MVETASSASSALLSRAAAARRLGKSNVTLARWERRGEGPPRVVIGGRPYYRASQIDEWLARKTAAAA